MEASKASQQGTKTTPSQWEPGKGLTTPGRKDTFFSSGSHTIVQSGLKPHRDPSALALLRLWASLNLGNASLGVK